MTRIAVNGLGRIGRAVFKIALDYPYPAKLLWQDMDIDIALECTGVRTPKRAVSAAVA